MIALRKLDLKEQNLQWKMAKELFEKILRILRTRKKRIRRLMRKRVLTNFCDGRQPASIIDENVGGDTQDTLLGATECDRQDASVVSIRSGEGVSKKEQTAKRTDLLLEYMITQPPPGYKDPSVGQ
eukprot:IDg19500t1